MNHVGCDQAPVTRRPLSSPTSFNAYQIHLRTSPSAKIMMLWVRPLRNLLWCSNLLRSWILLQGWWFHLPDANHQRNDISSITSRLQFTKVRWWLDEVSRILSIASIAVVTAIIKIIVGQFDDIVVDRTRKTNSWIKLSQAHRTMVRASPPITTTPSIPCFFNCSIARIDLRVVRIQGNELNEGSTTTGK